MRSVLLILRWVCAFLGWCLFFFWWRKAATPGWVSPRAVTFSLLSILAVVSAAVIYSSVWIFHNKRLAKKGKRGFVSFYKPPNFKADALGRKLTLVSQQHDEFESILVIRQSGDHKEYVAEGPVNVKGANA